MNANPIDERIGARLRRVRDELGLSAEYVCKRIGINSQPTLSDIERGKRPAKASELARLCKLYCKDSWYFLREDEPEEQPLICAWRNSQDTESRALIEAQVYALARNYQLLEEVTDEMRLPSLEPWSKELDLTWTSVAGKAKDLVKDWNLGARPAASLHEILEEKLHIKVVSYDLQCAGSALTAEGEFGYIVALNAKEVPWRKNFSLAHELFHLLSKNRYPLSEIHHDTAMDSIEKKPRYERLADTFAATLLMPAEDTASELKKRLDNHNLIKWVDLVGIAVEFGVSTEAMLWRLKNLGRLTTDRVNQLLASAAFRSIDQSSRIDDRKGGLEFSRRMVRFGLKALKLGKISKGKFCQIFKTTRAEFDSFISLYGDLRYDESDPVIDTDPIELLSQSENTEGRATA